MAEAAPTLWQRLCYTRIRDAVRGRFDASLDWRLAVADADLPSELAEAVGQVVKRTRLWRREKVDVATELIAHFQDGLEAGRTPQQLIASFGDPRQAAQLIRRAKKRNRPLTWFVWHYGWMTLAGLCLAYLLAGVYMMTGRPSIKVDYLAISNERAKSVPEAERAWPLYRDALLAMGAKSDRNNYEPVHAIPNGDATPGDTNWPKFERFLRDHADSIAKLREAAERPDLGFVASISYAAFTPKEQKLFGVSVTKEQIDAYKAETVEDRLLVSTLFPHLQFLRTSAIVLAGDARRAALAGDGDIAMAGVIAMHGISRHVEEAPFLVSLLSASDVENQCYDVIQDILTRQPQLWSNGQLRDLAHQVGTSQIDWRRGFDAERNFFYDILQRIYTDDGQGDGRLAYRITNENNFFQMRETLTGESPNVSTLSNDALAVLALPAASMFVESRKEATETFERIIGRAMIAFETPLWKQEGPWPLDIDPSLQSTTNFDSLHYLIVRMLVPDFEGLRNRVVCHDGARDGVLIGLALELYHREHESWPKSLGELSPRWLPAVPVDRITGQPLGYKIVGDRSVVYSLGVDRDDDGGRVPSGDEKALNASDFEPSLASPCFFDANPVIDDEHDGDWVIWSTVERE